MCAGKPSRILVSPRCQDEYFMNSQFENTHSWRALFARIRNLIGKEALIGPGKNYEMLDLDQPIHATLRASICSN